MTKLRSIIEVPLWFRRQKLSAFFTNEIEYKKRKAELRFWEERLSSKGGIDYWRKLYFDLYCHYLGAQQDSFAGKVLMDIGCGPHGVVSMFEAKFKLGVDPFVYHYRQMFNLHNKNNVKYLSCGGEDIPLPDETVDVVISRNAIDHVDDVRSTFCEVHRVLRNEGEIIFSINYQDEPSICEPHVLNDETLRTALQDIFDFEIVKRFPENYDSEIGGAGQFKYPHEIVTIRGTKL